MQPILAAQYKTIYYGRDTLDLEDANTIRNVVQDIRSNIVVNATAYTAVDRAEIEPDQAVAINGAAPTVMSKEAQKLRVSLLHMSTDYVLDGQKNIPYLESVLLICYAPQWRQSFRHMLKHLANEPSTVF